MESPFRYYYTMYGNVEGTSPKRVWVDAPTGLGALAAAVGGKVARTTGMALRRGLPAQLDHWGPVRDAIYWRITDRGWSPARQAFAQYEDGDMLDAAVLTTPLTKFISRNDPVWLSTPDALGNEPVSDSLVRRYDRKARPAAWKATKARSPSAPSGTSRPSPAPDAWTKPAWPSRSPGLPSSEPWSCGRPGLATCWKRGGMRQRRKW